MHAHGCVGSQYRGNEVSSARGDVCMHDLGLRVAGKFPVTSCRDSFCKKKIEQQAKTTQNIDPGRHRPCIPSSNSKRTTTTTKPPHNQQNSAPVNIWQNTASAKCHR